MKDASFDDAESYQARVRAAFEAAAATVEENYGIPSFWLKERFMLMSPAALEGKLVFKDATSRTSFTVDLDAREVTPARDHLVSRIGRDDPIWRREASVDPLANGAPQARPAREEDVVTDDLLRRRLVSWINEHDTGSVKPTAIDCGLAAGVQVFGEAVLADGSVVTTVDVIHNYRQARDVLGY